MKWEVFDLQNGTPLSDFNDIEDADKFIASFEDTDIGTQLQVRQIEPSLLTSAPVLRIIRGCPGAGKTTFASKHFPGVFHVENDMFLVKGNTYSWSPGKVKRAIEWCSAMVKNALSNHMDVIVCNTFTKLRFIKHYEDLANAYGARFQVWRCIGNFKNVHGLDDSKVESFKNAMEDWPGEIVVGPAV